MARIKIALAGIGNSASALVQGLEYYKGKSVEDSFGLIHYEFAGYNVEDIEVVAAFDVAEGKVGKDLSEAIFAAPNNVMKFADVPKTGVTVKMAPVLDGIDEHLKVLVKISSEKPVDVAEELKKSGAEILINLVPGGAEKASLFYAEEALKAGVGFINAAPVEIATNKEIAEKYKAARLPLIGDDLQDQLGSTVLNRDILQLLVKRGVKIDASYQLDVGGGLESLDTHVRWRLKKREIKSKAIAQDVPYDAALVAGSSDYVDFLGNARESYFYLRGFQFGGAPIDIDIRFHVTDGPNAAAVLLDTIRAAKLAIKRKIGGPLVSVCAYGFKNPPQTATLSEAERMIEDFILGKRTS